MGNVLYDQGSRPVVGPDGTLYVFWDGATRLATLDSIWMVKSTNGGLSWSKPVAVSKLVDIPWSPAQLIFPALDATNRTPDGYDTLPPSVSLTPDTRRVDTFFPAVAISPSGRIYMSAYAADVVSPWQTCAKPASPTAVGRINCLQLGPYINNARLDYVVTDLSTTQVVTTHPINSRYGFGGDFFGDYSDIAVGSDNTFHAFWTDTNNQQAVDWWYGFEFAPGTLTNQQDVVTSAGNF